MYIINIYYVEMAILISITIS